MLPTLHAAADSSVPAAPPLDLLDACLDRIDHLEERSAPGSSWTAECAAAGGAAHRGNPPRRLARPAARHPARHQGHLRRLRLADRGRLAAVGAQHRPPGRHGGAAAAPGRGGVPRQDGDDAVRQLRPAADAQSVGPERGRRAAPAAARRRRWPAACAWGRSARRRAARSPGRRRSAAWPAASRPTAGSALPASCRWPRRWTTPARWPAASATWPSCCRSSPAPTRATRRPRARPVPDYAAALAGEPRAPRLGRLRGLFEDLAEPVTREHHGRGRASACGARGRWCRTWLCRRRSRRCCRGIASSWRSRRRCSTSRGCAATRRITARISARLLEEGLACPAPEYARCKEHQRPLKTDMLACFDGVDVLLTPATTGPAPDAATTGDPAFNSPWSYTGLPTVSFPGGLEPGGVAAGDSAGRPAVGRGRPVRRGGVVRGRRWNSRRESRRRSPRPLRRGPSPRYDPDSDSLRLVCVVRCATAVSAV